MPMPVRAETGMQATSPPQSSVMMPYLVRLFHHTLGVGGGLIHLVDGHDDAGSLAALAWLMDSTVWGMMPSSAATTRTAMSVMHGAAGTHGGECLMARGIEEGDEAAVDLDLIGADVPA